MAEVAELEMCNLVGSPISSGEDDDEAPESVSFNQGREEALQSKARALHELQRFVGTCYITSRNNNTRLRQTLQSCAEPNFQSNS